MSPLARTAAVRPTRAHAASEWQLAALVGAAGAALCALAALSVAAGGVGEELRDWYALRLPPPDRGLGEALGFAVQNGRLALLGFAGAALLGVLPRARLLFDPLLAALFAANVVLVGAALGAYGLPLLRTVALHWPLELAAFAVAGGCYLRARLGRRVELRALAAPAAAAACLVLLAGLAEAEGL